MKLEKLYDVGVVVGRFQVPNLTEGHQRVLATAFDECKQVLVFLGVSVVQDSDRNPLDYRTRELMFSRLYQRDIQILPIPDSFDDVIWSKELDKRIHEVTPCKSVQLYCGRDGFKESYHGRFPVTQIREVSSSPSGTDVRDDLIPIGSSDFRTGVIYAKVNQYPKVHPTVDVAIWRRDERGNIELLMAKKPNEVLWRFVGGFADPDKDDNYEAAAIREASEETGGSLEFARPVYIGSLKINDWRYRKERNKIITAFFATAVLFGMAKPTDDIVECGWLKLDTLGVNDLLLGHRVLLQALKERAPWQ